MLEFIGFITLCFICYKVLNFFILKNKQFNNIKGYIEVENIATNELNIPKSYFNYLISEEIEDIKELTEDLKTSYPNASWQLLMAFTIYTCFYDDLASEHPIFDTMEIDINKFDVPDNIKNCFINSRNDYINYTNYELEGVILESAKINNISINHHYSLIKRIIKYTEQKNYFLDKFDGGMGFFAKDIDHKNDYAIFIKPSEENSQNRANLVRLNVGILPK